MGIEGNNNQRSLRGCPGCGGYKRRTTHTYATYRVYVSGGTNIILKCKKCGHELKFKTIRGGAI